MIFTSACGRETGAGEREAERGRERRVCERGESEERDLQRFEGAALNGGLRVQLPR